MACRRVSAPLLALLLLLAPAEGCFRKWVTFEARRIEALSVTSIDKTSFRLVSRCLLHNPNALDATVREVRFVAKSGEHILGRGALKGPLEVRANTSFHLDAPLTVRYADLPADFPQRVAKGTLPLSIETRLVASTSLGRYEMSIVSRGQPTIAKALSVAVKGSFRSDGLVIENYTLGRLALRGVTLDLHARLRNAFAFPVRIRRAVYEVAVNGKPFGKGKLDQPVALAPKATVRRRLQVRASHGNLGRAFGAMLGKDPRFRVRGTIWIDPVGGVSKVPIDLEADSSVFED